MGLIAMIKDYSKIKEAPRQRLKKIKKERYELHLNLQAKRMIAHREGQDVLSFVTNYLDTTLKTNHLVATSTTFNIEKLDANKYENIVNLKKINDARYVNKFLEAVNSKLPFGGLYINSVETYSTRKARLLKKYSFPLNHIYLICDLIFMRVFPKLWLTKKIYFFITKGRNRVLTRAETFGRLYSCGFEIIDERKIDNRLFFVVKKIKDPVFDNNPSYGLLIRLRRVGKNGKVFNVFKLRTMHAYAEYLQEYVHKKNDIKEGGKFNNDFRITPEGKFFRKFWLDELPMIINVLKGEMKIVGVRPLSKHYFNLYSKELQNLRTKYKPGLVPPFYADMPKNLDEIILSETNYLNAYEKNPYKTDIQYFFRAFYNILIKGARSS